MDRIKRNVAKLIMAGADDATIENYLADEGYTKQQYLFVAKGFGFDDLKAAGVKPGVEVTDEILKSVMEGQKVETETPPSSLEPESLFGIPVEKRPWQQQPTQSPGTRMESFGQGAKYGAEALGLGALGIAKDLGVPGLPPKGMIDTTIQSEATKNQEISAKHPWWNLGGQITGEIGATFWMGPTRGMNIPSRIATSTAASGVLGSLGAKGRGHDPVSAGIISMGIGAGLSALSETGLRYLANKIGNSGENYTSREVQDTLEDAAREGIPVFVDDLVPPGVRRRLGILAESLPLGTTRGRLQQNEAQRQAAQRLFNDLSEGFGDLHGSVKASMADRLARNKLTANVLFNRASRELDSLGPIDMSQVRSVAQHWANELARIPDGARPESLLKEVQAFVNSGDDLFSNVRSIRDHLSSRARETFGTPASRPLQALKNAFDDTLEQTARASNSPGARLYREALGFYRRTIVPFKKGRLKAFVSDAAPEEIIASLRRYAGRSMQGSRTQANRMFQALDERGRRAVQGSLIEEALNRASRGEVFNPTTFTNHLDDIQNVTNVFFRGRDRIRLEGLKRVLRATARAGQVAENPPTGNRLITALQGAGLGAAAMMDIGTFGAVAGGMTATGGGMRILYQSPRIRNLLFALGRSTPDSRVERELLFKVTDMIRRIMSSQAEQRKRLTEEYK